MKTLVTVGEFRDNGGVLKQGREIFVDSEQRGLHSGGRQFEELTKNGEFAIVHYACNMVSIHVENCYIQIEVTPIWK